MSCIKTETGIYELVAEQKITEYANAAKEKYADDKK